MGKGPGRARHVSYDNVTWKCDNCGDEKTPKDRRRKGEAGNTVYDRVLAKLEKEKEDIFGERWAGYCTFEELEEMADHHATREWRVHSDFGIVPVPKRTLHYYFKADSFRKRSAERLAEKTGRPVEASLSIRRFSRPSGYVYEVTVSGIYAFTDDERKNYYPL